MQQVDGAKARLLGRFVRGVLEHHGNGTGENGQHLPGGGHRQSNGDTGGNALVAHNHQNGGDNAGQRRIWRLRCPTFIQPRAISSSVPPSITPVFKSPR